MSYEKPTRPILKVAKPRPLVDLATAISSALLMNELQWVGIIVTPINYSLKDAVLHIDTGPGLRIEEAHGFEIEKNREDASQNRANMSDPKYCLSHTGAEVNKLALEDGNIRLPDWASNITSVLWIPLQAVSDGIARGATAGMIVPQGQSLVDALKLEFGVSHNQTFEKTIAVHFTDPFDVSTRVIDKCDGGTLLLQVILQSQVKASLTVHDACLDLQDCFDDTGEGNGRPLSGFFPFIVSPKSKAGMLFSICLADTSTNDDTKQLCPDSILNIRYKICGSRKLGAHTPVADGLSESGADDELFFTFRSALTLQRPVLDPCLAVGFLPLPSSGLRVGQFVTIEWRVERLKNMVNGAADNFDEVLYEVNVNPENWMIAGRKRGYISLSTKQGSRIVVSILFLPLVAGYVHPPQLGLPNVEEANISCNPRGPHLVCVLPPALSSSLCIPA